MGTVRRWSGREARALRQASRLSVRAFADHLGVSHRTVSKWEAGDDSIFPLPESQALLDTALARACAEIQKRFREFVESPETSIRRSVDRRILVASPEPGLIRRTDDYEQLVAFLMAGSAAEAGDVVAVCGPGGFGKTTLTTQVCHDPRVGEAFPEILWVETGEACTPARVVELIADLCVHLEGDRQVFRDPEQAGFHLAHVLGDRMMLLVIDNVWSAADLSPFLLGGGNCVRLVATRNARVCPTRTKIIRVGPMTSFEIRELLSRNVAALDHPDVGRLGPLVWRLAVARPCHRLQRFSGRRVGCLCRVRRGQSR